MSKLMKQGLCVLLCMLMIVTAVPTQVFAAAGKTEAADEDGKPTTITNADGSTTAIGDEWEQAYPYGVFAFSNAATTVVEGDEAVTVPVYRLGGTKGRATAYVIYNPAVNQLDENKFGYANALSTDDIELEVEDASPIAQYQPLGKDPDPEPGDCKLKVDAKGEEYTVSLSKSADQYKWQAIGEKGWEDIFDESEDSLTVEKDDYVNTDFRCVYTIDGVSYCTESVRGEKYVKPEPEVLPEMPDDLDLSETRTYTKLEADQDDAYKAYAFSVTFAEGEWFKNIRITPKEDDLSECPEAAALIIQDCEGGCINKSFNSTTVSVEDNDPAEPFTLGLTETEIEADKADGSVTVTVRRIGGFQEMVSIDYETVDGTAVAGKDYVADSDTLALVGDVMELSVTIQLMDDGIKSDKPKDFKLRLKDLKGDSENLCILKDTEVTISLINSGTSKKKNLATKLTDADAIDLSSAYDSSTGGVVDTAPGTVTGTQVESEPIYADIKKGGSVQGMLKSYRYPNTISFSKYFRRDESDYWGYMSYIFDNNPQTSWTVQNGASITSYPTGGHTSDDFKISCDNPDGFAALSIPDMTKLYKKIVMSHRMFSRGEDKHGNYVLEGTAGVGTYSSSGGHQILNSGGEIDFGMSDNENAIVAEFYRTNSGDVVKNAVHLISSNSWFCRRSFSADTQWYLTIHTANDGESGPGNVITAPDGGAALKTDTGIYDSFEPLVSIAQYQGGVRSDNRDNLYVGTKLEISLVKTATYSALSLEDLNVAVYLTNSQGVTVKQAKKGSDSTYYLTLLWDGMTEADLDDSYTINVVMTRKQNLSLDITPSVPRADDGITVDLTRASEAEQAFWDSGEDFIEYGYSKPIAEAPYFSKDGVETVKVYGADNKNPDCSLNTDDSKALIIPDDIKDNIQWVNFHRDHDDFIVINGLSYHGDETIWLAPKDLNVRNLIFFYYSASYADVASKMVSTIDKIGLYIDKNGNNKIDGEYNTETGFFIPDPDSGDELLMYMDDDSSYSEKMFDYIKNSDGSYSQLFYKVYYIMNPRALIAKEGTEADRAQVMPALTTSVTDPANYFSLTDEQKNYRYLISGKYKNDTYTSDNHLMYGAEATAIQYVDVPLGGDKNPAQSEKDSDGLVHHTWEPQYEGNLLFPYENPEPIYIANSVAGENIPLAPDYDSNGTLSEKDIKNLNGYLGSYVADTKVALCVFQQEKTVADILAERDSGKKRGIVKGENGEDPDQPSENSGLNDPESASPINPDNMPDPAANGDGEIDDGGSDNIATQLTAGLDMDYGINSPKFSFGLCNVSVVTDLRDYILGIDFPIIRGGASTADKQWDYGNDLTDYYTLYKEKIKNGKTLADAVKELDKTYKEAKDTRNSSTQKPRIFFMGFSAYASISVAMEWKYDPVQNKSIFKRMTFALVVGVEGSLTWRPILAFPMFYICVSGGVSFSFGTGFYYKQYNVYEDTKLFNKETGVEKNKYLKNPKTGKDYFKVDYRSLTITFKGKIGIELFEDEACTKEVPKSESPHTGFVQSNTMTDMDITLTGKGGYKFKDDKSYYLKISAQDDNVTVKSIEQITNNKKESFCDGLDIGISPFLNVSIGVGGGIVKAEICFHFGCDINYAYWREGAGKNKIKTVDWELSASFNVMCVFNISFEIAAIYRSYDSENGGWGPIQWRTGGKGGDVKKASLRSGKIDYDAVLSLPDDTSDTRTVYQTQKKSGSYGLLKSYKPEDVSVPFELSGYYTSSDAARLLDGVGVDSDYRVVTAKNADGKDVNYVFYHISRNSADSTLDQNMLVMSELVMTGEQKGLVNPTDPESATPYIVVDVDENGNPDDTGDLDFSVDTINGGSAIRVAWVSYTEAADADTPATIQALSDLTKKMVVKTATYTSGSASFTPFEIVSDENDENADNENGECVSIPDFSQDAVVFVRSNHIPDEELEEKTALYEDYLRTQGYDVSNTDDSEDARARQSYGISLVAAQRASWALSGSSSDVCVKIGDSAVSSIPMGDNITVDSVKIQKIGDQYYIAYTANEDCFTDADGNVTDNTDEIANRLTIKRMYLRTCSLEKDDDGKDSVKWGMGGKAILLRTLYDYDNNDVLTDGIYAGGTITRKDSPCFGNLQFLNANLGDSLTGEEESLPLRGSSSEDFLLFDMCGSTYVIRQSSLQSMTGSAITTDDNGQTTTTATIIPFFTPDISNTTDNGARASSGRTETTIGVDGDGNLAAVYTASVPNTNNTALCISKYDPQTGWGDKTVLAMNYLGVYEDNQKYFRSNEDAAEAFFGVLDTDDESVNQGGLNEFQFKNPQIALGKETVVDSDGTVTQKPTLMILTQGVMQYLKENPNEDSKEHIPYLPADTSEVLGNPDSFERSKDVPPGVGVYAIEYGSGTQEVGNVTFSMPVEDFSIGASPNVTVGFDNTGDVAIRGSKDQPITVSMATSIKDAAPLAQWQITENIISGQHVALSGNLNLTETLPVGTKVFLTVEEDPYYESQGGTPYKTSSKPVVEIEEHPELGITDQRIVFDTVHDDGDTLIDVDFIAGNRGTADAKNVSAVFSYDTGAVDEDGNAIFAPLDLSNAQLTVEDVELKRGIRNDLANGELYLGNTEVGHGKHVSGTLKVSSECFNEKATKAFVIKIELFSDADEGLLDGLHNEYNSSNNIYKEPVEHQAVFTAPVNITVPSGTELRIPIDCAYTTGDETPHILVTEFPDLEGDIHFGAHAFRYGEFANGNGSGTLELKAESEGSGYIRIQDANTNSFFDIAYTITPPVKGINIYNDNSIFTFYNADGTQFDEQSMGQAWQFPSDVNAWGADDTVPYLNNLSAGMVQTSFTFKTEAESIDLIFDGKAVVSSTWEGFEPVTVSASGGDGDEDGEFATVTFGKNPKGLVHTVTVTVSDGVGSPTKYAYFDRVIEHFNEVELPVPNDDENAPQLFFARSLPQAGSIAAKTADNTHNSVSIKAYVFDETGIASVTVNSKTVPIVQKDDVRFWTVLLEFSENGDYTITAIDDYGNMANYQLNVDWFNDDSAQEDLSEVPQVDAKLIKKDKFNVTTDLTDDVSLVEDDRVFIKASGKTPDNGTPELSVTGVTINQKDGLVTFPAESTSNDEFRLLSSGWFIVTASDPQTSSESWSTAVVEMMRIPKKLVYVTADDQTKACNEDMPELTYQTIGLLGSDTLSGSLACDISGGLPSYPITQGTLTAPDEYKLIFTPGTLTVQDHSFAQPVWNWHIDQNVVELDVDNNIDIHPTYYTLNGGEPIEAFSGTTQYVISGQAFSIEDYLNNHITVHDHETSHADYHICFKNTMVFPASGDYFTVNGTGASVNVSFSGQNWLSASKHVFASGSMTPADAEIKVAAESGAQVSLFLSGNTEEQYSIIDGIHLSVAGDYTISAGQSNVDTQEMDDYDKANEYPYIGISGSEGVPDDFGVKPPVASASLTCSKCGFSHTETDSHPVCEEIPATCTVGAVDKYTATVICFGQTYTDSYTDTTGQPLGHDFIAGDVVPPTCIAGGYTVYTCSRCGVTENRDETAPSGIHTYGDPVWFWSRSWDVVTLDMSDGIVVDIHPTYYTVNGGVHIEKDSAATRYVFTGENTSGADNRLILHDSESSAATYNICLSDLVVYESAHEFIKVKGEKATVNLSLCGDVTLELSNHAFSSDANDTNINIGVEGSGYASLTSKNSTVADDKISLNKVGDYSFMWASDLSELSSKPQVAIYCTSDNPDPFNAPYTACAVFTCMYCEHRESVDASVTEEIQDGVHRRTATAQINGKQYTDVKTTEYFIGHSISLNGSIGINYYLDVPEDLVKNGKVRVDFSWKVDDKEKTHSITLTPEDKYDLGYKASCPVAAAEMTYYVTASLTIDGVLQDETDTYSVKRYADVILSDKNFKTKYTAEMSEDKYNQLVTLVKTMLDCGAKAQKQFKRDENHLANQDLVTDDEESPYYYAPVNVTADMITTGATDMNAADFSSYGLQYSGSTIVYLSETSIRHYFKITDQDKFDSVKENITFGSNTPVGYTVKGDEIYFEIKNIAAAELDSLFTMSINGTKYQYSVLDYVKACLASDKTSANMKALAAATYHYNQAANNYFGR